MKLRFLTLLASALIVFGLPASTSAQATVPVSDREVLRGDPSAPNIALVFNVGAGHTPGLSILDILAEKNYRATFFVMGWWAERHPDVLRMIAERGHEIASHGHSIFDLTLAPDGAVRSDLLAADDAISAVTGRSTRPLWSPSAGYRDARVRAIAADLGWRPIIWTADSGDWTWDATSESVYSQVMSRAVNGAIVVMHFDSPTTNESTAQVLPQLIDHLREGGFNLTSVTELLTAG